MQFFLSTHQMKIETIIYIVLGIVFFLYRQYTEYVKKDAEARKKASGDIEIEKELPKPDRNLGKTLEELFGFPALEKEEFKNYDQPESIPTYGEIEYPYEGKNPEKIKEKVVKEKYFQEKYVPMKSESLKVRERINPEMVSKEVRSGKTIHEEHDHNFRLKNDQDGEFEFDLENAVIQSIILERRF